MHLISDLHLHSKYSRAVSRNMIVAEMSRQADKKGIDLLGTGDWFHSLWVKQLKSDLEEWSDGIYKSRENPNGAKFLLSAEISNIFKQGGISRRVHTLVFSPSIEVCEKISEKLVKRGCNLASDGRPMIGLSVKELAEVIFSVSDKCMVIPAHVWTPWYSLYGSKSGFDSIEEAYGEYAERIYAVETGLSSDPSMNWSIKELERRTIVSFSDAHSGPKLGREATVFKYKKQDARNKPQEYSYKDVCDAISERYKGENKGKLEVAYTVEFYPEEGKYHFTGHRKCGVVQSPAETKKQGTVCHVCGKPLTVGVMHRVQELAKGGDLLVPEKRKSKAGVVGYYDPNDKGRPPYVMLVPLQEILAEVIGVGAASKRVQTEYGRLVSKFDDEFAVLLKSSIEDLKDVFSERLAKAVARVREGNIKVIPGHDGVFGTVKIWGDDLPEEKTESEQIELF